MGGLFFLGLKRCLEILSAKGPLMRMIPIPLSPKEVAIAAMVSCSNIKASLVN